MTQPLPPGDRTPEDRTPAPLGAGALAAELPAELQAIIEAVDGVTAVYPARPLWQTIAGAARSAVTGEAPAPVDVATSGAGTAVTTVTVRIGVSGAYPAPDVARAVAAAVRRRLSPNPVSVQVGIVRIGNVQIGEN